MDNTQLARCLQSVGKQVFVGCFWPLRAVALGRLSRAARAQTIINQGHGIKLTGALLRISWATAIFEAGRERDAIDLVIASSHPASLAPDLYRRVGAGDPGRMGHPDRRRVYDRGDPILWVVA